MESRSSTNLERRSAIGEVRAASSGKLKGYAAVFGKESVDLGGFREILERGCFTNALRSSDIRGLLNHDPNFVLGRVSAGTMRVWQDSTGLGFEITPPNTSQANAILESVRRGDISQCSFAFRIADNGDRWTQGANGLLRTISNVAQLYDVGPVTLPSYEDTVVSVRARARVQSPDSHRYAKMRAELDRLAGENEAALEEINERIRNETARGLSDLHGGAGPLVKQRRQMALAMDNRNARAIAIHEAGHAVAAYIEGTPVTYLRFTWSDDGKPIGGGYYGDGRSSVRVLLSGIAAERLFGLNPPPDVWKHDRTKAHARSAAIDIELEVDRAQDALRPYSPAIRALADELMRETEVLGDRAEKIIRQAMRRVA